MCPLAKRFWLFMSVVWIAYVAWRTHFIWPHVPLDMGGASPSRDAAYQAAQLQHVAKALALALAVPAIGYAVGRLACHLLGKSGGDAL